MPTPESKPGESTEKPAEGTDEKTAEPAPEEK
jgi:hypothetical protein